MRNWQGVLVVILFVPASTPWDVLGRGVALPVTALLAPGHGLGWHLAYIVGLEAVAVAWIVPQRSALLGASFMNYVSALPLGDRAFTLIDAVLLLVADSVLFLPFFFGVVVSAHDPGITTALQVVALVTVVLLLLLLQLTVLEASWVGLEGAAVTTLLLTAALSVSAHPTRWILISATLLSLGSIVLIHPSCRRRHAALHQGGLRRRVTRRRPGLGLRSRQFPLRIQGQALVARGRTTAVRLGWALVVAVGTAQLLGIFRYDRRSLPMLTIALAVIALELAGLYRILQTAHEPMRRYLATLPLRRGHMRRCDVLTVLLLGLLPLGILVGPIMVHGAASAVALVILVFAYLLLLTALRWPVVSGGRQALLLALLMASGWSGAVMAAVVR